MTEEIHKSCDICKTVYDTDITMYNPPFIYNKDKKLLSGGCCSKYESNSCDENTYISTEDLDISSCCNNCFKKLYEKGVLLFDGYCLMDYTYGNLNIPFENCSTNNLQEILNYEEKHVEKLKKVLNEIKDILKNREG